MDRACGRTANWRQGSTQDEAAESYYRYSYSAVDAIWNLRERKRVFEPYEELSIQIQGSNLATVDRKQSL